MHQVCIHPSPSPTRHPHPPFSPSVCRARARQPLRPALGPLLVAAMAMDDNNIDRPTWLERVHAAATQGPDQLVALGFPSGSLRASAAFRPCQYNLVGRCKVPKEDSGKHRSIKCSVKNCLAAVHVVCALDSVSEIATPPEWRRLFCVQHVVSQHHRNIGRRTRLRAHA